jgi:hypothetical protein
MMESLGSGVSLTAKGGWSGTGIMSTGARTKIFVVGMGVREILFLLYS